LAVTAHGRGGPGPGPGTGGPQALRLALWLAAVLAGCALSFMGVTALAPSISQSLQLSPQSIGLFSGALWASALVASLWGGPVVARFGPWAATRACLVFCALGLLAIAAGNPAMFWLGAVLIGLGHGLEAPPASQLLGHFVAVARRPFIFSLKQMGVQAGAVVASLSLPAAALLVGWQATLTVAAVLLFVLAAMITRPARLMPMPMPKSMPQQPPAGRPPGPGLRPSGGARAFVSALSWSATLGALVHWLPTLQRQPGLLRLSLAACC